MYFPTTHWSLLAQASLAGETSARAALDELCRRYWRPLNQFLRMRGYSETDAEDLTQAFLLHLLERSALSKADQFRGKFRSFLLGALVKFLAHERNYRQAQKRGGQSLHLSIEALSEENVEVPAMPETDVKAFDRAWALNVLRIAMDKIQQDYLAADKKELFKRVAQFSSGSERSSAVQRSGHTRRHERSGLNFRNPSFAPSIPRAFMRRSLVHRLGAARNR